MSTLSSLTSTIHNQNTERSNSKDALQPKPDNFKFTTLSEIALLSQEQALDLFFAKGA